MKQLLRSGGALGVATVLATLAVGSTQSAAADTTPVTQCPVPTLLQPFAGDSHWYTLAPGQSADSFDATGWTLTGGAQVVTQTLADGTSGPVLDLPAGSTATSPAMCVDDTYPLARMELRTLGSRPDVSARFYTVPVGSGLTVGMPVPAISNWTASLPELLLDGASGAEQVQFELVAGAKAADLQVYNLYIDPSMRK